MKIEYDSNTSIICIIILLIGIMFLLLAFNYKTESEGLQYCKINNYQFVGDVECHHAYPGGYSCRKSCCNITSSNVVCSTSIRW